MTKTSLRKQRRGDGQRFDRWRLSMVGMVGLAAIAVACQTAPSEAPPAAGANPPEQAAEPTDEPRPAAPSSSAEAAPAAPANPVSPEKQDCGQLGTQSDINACAQANYAVSDRLLNQVYQTLRSTLSADDKSKLTTAEQAWIDFRDAQCEFERNRFDGGSIAPLILSSCLEQITDQRIAELRTQIGATQTYEVADTRLNQAYQELRTTMDESVWPSFQAVQVDWLAYRDANCAYEAEATIFTREQCLARMTVLRTAQLEQQIEQWSL